METAIQDRAGLIQNVIRAHNKTKQQRMGKKRLAIKEQKTIEAHMRILKIATPIMQKRPMRQKQTQQKITHTANKNKTTYNQVYWGRI